jgi:hypothetical protein
MYGGMGVLLVAALVIAGIQSQKKLVGEGYITAAQEGRVFDLWAFFHYLVPALIGTSVTLIFSAVKGISGSALLIIGTASTMTVATLWEFGERRWLGAGRSEYPSNIVGDVVIGTVGGAVASTAFIFALGKKIPAVVVVAVGLGFASLGFAVTSGLIWFRGIRPEAGIDTWPDHRLPLAPDPINTNVG